MEQGFRVLRAEHLISVIEPPNVASIRVAEKLGERFERRQQLQGKEVCIYDIERARWLARAHQAE